MHTISHEHLMSLAHKELVGAQFSEASSTYNIKLVLSSRESKQKAIKRELQFDIACNCKVVTMHSILIC